MRAQAGTLVAEGVEVYACLWSPGDVVPERIFIDPEDQGCGGWIRTLCTASLWVWIIGEGRVFMGLVDFMKQFKPMFPAPLGGRIATTSRGFDKRELDGFDDAISGCYFPSDDRATMGSI